MASRKQAARSSEQRMNKVRRARRASKSKFRPRLESLEPRMLLAGFWTQFQAANLPNGPTAGVQTSMLLSNGVVLEAQNTAPIFPGVNGGAPPQQTIWFPYSPTANGSYANGTYGLTSTMNNPRLGFPAVTLRDGKIFAMGGEYSPTTGFVNSPEIYDPLTNTWTSVAPIPTPLTQVANPPSVPPLSPTSQFGDDPIKILPNGDILAGWFGGGNTYIYNEASNSWRPTFGPKLHASTTNLINTPGAIATDASDEENWTILPDGSILSYDIFASFDQSKFLAQRFDPQQDAWVDASLVDPNNPPVLLSGPNEGFELGASMLLNDGRVIVFGPNGHSDYYDSKTGIWSKGPDMPFTTAGGAGPQLLTMEDAPAAELSNGKLLLVASAVGAAPPTRVLEFDPTTNIFTDVTPPNFPTLTFNNFSFNGQEVFNMLNLPSGQILLTTIIASGNGNTSGPDYLYTPDGLPQDAWRPTIQSITQNADGTFHLIGTQLNGLNEGAVFGDDFSMSSNYPLVRMTDTSGNVVYARTFNWSNTGVQTGNQIVSTEFALPAGKTFNDFNDFTVVANGIPSVPFHFSPAKPQTVSGTVFSDTNADGIREGGEAGIPHITVFVDLNGDGKLSVMEPASVTDNFGRWSFSNIQPGSYVIREVPSPGILSPAVQTTPGAGAVVPLSFIISNFEHPVITDSITGKRLDFGHIAAYDFGDAPDGQLLPNGVVAHYGTLLASDGPRAGILPGFGLGSTIDAEPDGQPTIGANGDDVVNAASNPPKIDDEDGVTFGAMTPGFPVTITVSVSTGGYTPGKLQGWIDWNQNGKFDANEQVATNVSMAAGAHSFTINVPSTAKIGPTYARFRYGYESNLGPTGLSLAGEVEDYQVNVLPAVPIANPDIFPVPGRSTIAARTGDVTNGNTVISNLSIATSDLAVGDLISGTGIPAGATIASIIDANRIRISAAATASSTAVSLTFVQPIIKPTSTNVHLDVLANDIGTVFGSPKIDPNSITPLDNFGSTFSVQFDAGLQRQVIVYNPGPGVQGGVPERFTYKVYTRTDQGGNPIDDSNAALVLINISFADNIAIDDTFTFSPPAPGAGVTALQIPVMQNDIASHAADGTAQVIAVDVRTAADTDKINNPNGTPTPPAAQTSVTVTTASGPATLQIDSQHPSTLDFFSPAGFEGTLIFKYEIDDNDPDTTPSTRYVTIQVVDSTVATATTGDANALVARQADPAATDNSLLAAGYLAELDVSVLPANPDGTVNTSTDPVNMVHAGDTFYLRVQSHDLRQDGNTTSTGVFPNNTPANRGVISAYLDLLLNPGFLNGLSIRNFASPQPDNPGGSLLSAIVFGPEYSKATIPQNGVTGLPTAPEFNEVGAISGPQPEENTLFPDVLYVRMIAKQATPAGQSITFTGDPADSATSDVSIPNEDQTTPGVQISQILTDDQVYLGQTTLTIMAEGEGEFVNFAMPADVNQDGTVAPNDLMIVINALNATGARALTGGTPTPHQMYDVNMDNALSPSDIVKLITFLNSFGSTGGGLTSAKTSTASGEGESSPAAATASTDLALLSTSSPATSSNSTTTTTAMPIVVTPAPATSTTDTSTSTSTPSSTSTSQTTSTSSDSVDANSADALFAALSATKRTSSGKFGI
jgi:GEVED domain-containing protein/dockerin type I repeat protein/Kelch motif protein/SdrD B-like protein